MVLNARAFTCACELLGRHGEQQLVGHVARPGTAGDARLLIAALHPVGQPLHVAVAVQRVGPQSAAVQENTGEKTSVWITAGVIFHIFQKTEAFKYLLFTKQQNV